MNLAENDLHLVFSPGERRLTVWSAAHTELFGCEARNKTVSDDGQWGHDSPMPPGEYRLGSPVRRDTIPFGKWFIPLFDAPGHDELARRGRSGLGLHGGGSGSARPFAPDQGFVVTHGCIRVLNQDLEIVAGYVQAAESQGGRCYLTVTPPLPGAAPVPDDGGKADELAPDE